MDVMPPADLVVHGRLVLPHGVQDATVIVRDGRIEKILPAGVAAPAGRLLDVGTKYVLPGLIDSHVHFRTPGLTHKEDWAHGSRAAVAGGVTTVIDMPNTEPPLFDPALAEAKAALIAGSSLADFRFHLGVDPDRPELMLASTPREAVSAKVFMAGHHCAPNVVRTEAQLTRIFAVAAEAGIRLVLHAEDQGVFDILDRWRAGRSGPVGSVAYRDYEALRPRSGGIVAAASVIRQVEHSGAAAHIVHVSAREEADLYAAAAAAGLPITFEVTAHHLSFTDADLARYGARIRLSPAIRQQADQERLWEAVFNGEAATVGSDHAPHSMAEKTRPAADAPPGLPGVQELATALFTGMRRRRPDQSVDQQLLRLVTLLGANPADMFGIADSKGRLAEGCDADLVIFDPDETWSLPPFEVQAKCGWSAYAGWLFTGRVRKTIRRGEVVYDAANSTFGEPGSRWLPARNPIRGGSHVR